MNLRSDEELVREFIEGRKNAFETLFRRYERKVYNLALKMLKDPDFAYDIVQEVFFKLLKHLPRFKSRSSFSTWLYSITMNACRDALKKAKRWQTSSLDECWLLPANPTQFEPAKISQAKEVQRVLIEAIGTLPHHLREVILLRDIEGLSYSEIAQVLNIPLGTVRSRLARARIGLARYLQKAELNSKDGSQNEGGSR
jgi:RNA polymerase sigma-70 factor (ECF subfamily)